MGIGALGNSSAIKQAEMNDSGKVDSPGAGNIKTLYGDASKTGMLSMHMGRMGDFYANVRKIIDQVKNDIG